MVRVCPKSPACSTGTYVGSAGAVSASPPFDAWNHLFPSHFIDRSTYVACAKSEVGPRHLWGHWLHGRRAWVSTLVPPTSQPPLPTRSHPQFTPSAPACTSVMFVPCCLLYFDLIPATFTACGCLASILFVAGREGSSSLWHPLSGASQRVWTWRRRWIVLTGVAGSRRALST